MEAALQICSWLVVLILSIFTVWGLLRVMRYILDHDEDL